LLLLVQSTIPMLNETNFKVWKEVIDIVLGCMNLDLTLRVEELILTLDNLQESQNASKFLEEIEQFFAKNEKVEMSNLLTKLISMKYKGRGNIRECIMEMSNLATKLKSLKLELDEDLIMHLVLIFLPTHFGQFKVSYIRRTNGPSMSLYLIVYKRKRGCREIRLKVLILLRSIRIRKGRTLRVLWKGLFKERNQRRMMNLSVSSVRINLTFVHMNTWWVDFGATTHISCLWNRSPSDDERFIFVGDANKIAAETIKTFKLQLKIGFHLDLFETFVVPSFRKNLISISSLDKFDFSCSFRNNKVSLYQNSNFVGSNSLIDNLYMLDVVSSHNEILQIGYISKQRIQRPVSNEIIESFDLSNFKICVECIKEKQTNIRKLVKSVLELIHTYIYGHFPTTSWNGQQYFITFITEVELQLGKKIKAVKSDCGGEYYDRYNGSRERCPKPFTLFLKECGIFPQYTMPSNPSMNSVGER
ncbi:hypothetical protein CR513_05971, partial [Mucuna pruriens]